jgi:hypothetical protein
MRIIIFVLALALLVVSSASALQKTNRGQCRKLGKQLEQHAASVDVAANRGNTLWAESTLQYMGQLDARRQRLCPDLYPEGNAAKAMAEMRRMLATAGKLALKFFTMGAM